MVKANIEFPCVFPLKVIGREPATFAELVLTIARRHVADLAAEALTTRPSAGGKYLAVTVTFTAVSREQLEAFYQELQAQPQVVTVL